MDLSDEQISELDKWVGVFRVANYEDRESMVECFLSNFESDWPQGVQKFDRYAVITVHAPFATLACSHIFLAYSPVPLWQSKAGYGELDYQYPKADGRRKVHPQASNCQHK